ncbi:MAG: glycosyltransferase family 2 protein [Flavobacteriaceae bacterium]
MKELAVVILNYNGQELLERFLPSVIDYSADAQIYIIDNQSEDQSVDWIKKHYSTQIKCVVLDKNYGFAEGYNRGLEAVEEPYWCLLNSDIRVSPNYTLRPIELLKENNSIAAVQPKIRSERHPAYFEYAGAAGGFLDYLGYPYCRGRLFQSIERDEGQYDDERSVFWTTGACMFIKKTAFYEIGKFDPDYFAHQEEIDLCWRAQHKGFQLWYTHNSCVYHLGGSTLSNANPLKTYLNFRNSLFTLFKNLGAQERVLVLLIRLILDGIAGLLFLIQLKPLHTWSILKAHFSFYSSISSLAAKRREIRPTAIDRSPFSIVFHHFVLGRKKILK